MKGSCDANTSVSVVSANCLNKNSCSFTYACSLFVKLTNVFQGYQIHCLGIRAAALLSILLPKSTAHLVCLSLQYLIDLTSATAATSVCAGPIAENGIFSVQCPPFTAIS